MYQGRREKVPHAHFIYLFIIQQYETPRRIQLIRSFASLAHLLKVLCMENLRTPYVKKNSNRFYMTRQHPQPVSFFPFFSPSSPAPFSSSLLAIRSRSNGSMAL